VLAALEAACQARLLVETRDNAYQFAHDVIREVVEGDLGAGRRMLLHRSVAEALETAPGDLPLDRLAYHYGHSGDQEKAEFYLERAGDQAQAQAACAAAQAAMREKLGASLKDGGRLDAALEVLDQAAATYRTAGDFVRWGNVGAQLGEVHQLQGTVAEALQHLKPVLVALEERSAWQGVAALGVIVAHLLGQAGRFEEQLVLARHAVDLARRVGDDRLLAYAQRRCSVALYIAGHADEAIAAMEEALRLAEGMGDLPTMGWTLRHASKMYADRGDIDTQRRCVARALEYAAQLDDPHLLVECATAHGALAFHDGDWALARREYERGLAASRRMSRSWLSVGPLGLLAQLSLAEGGWPEAAQYLTDGLRTAEAGGGTWILPWMQSVMAHHALLQGRPEEARARLAPLLAGPDLASRLVFQSMPVRVLLAWAQLDLSEVAAAAALASEAAQDARSTHSLPALADALWMEARVALRQRQWLDAEQAASEGLEVARRLRQPYREARLLHVLGELHRQKGEAAPARERWEAALAIFQRLGARPYGAEVARALAEF
jgi:tetratricopeptide (TPR) repeat protein